MAGKKFQLLSHANEKLIFISVLIINIFYICILRFLPSMDGPAHLYNSNILLKLTIGTPDYLNDFYSINSIIIPNWVSHFLLAGFRIILPAWLAEKLLLIIYITGLSLSFRLLIKQLNPENIVYSIFIFPFAYSLLFHMGFYNYCLSFIFYFLTLYYWMKTMDDHSFTKYFFILILLIFTYYASILTFLFLGFSIGILIIGEAFSEYMQKKDLRSCFISASRKLTGLFIAALPAIIPGILFFIRTKLSSTTYDTDSAELFKWLKDLRPLIVYNYNIEKIFTQLILYTLIILIIISVYYTGSQKSVTGIKKLRINYFFLIPALISLIALFLVPPSGFAGMMSDRLALMFFMTFIIYVLSLEFPEKIKYIFIPVILVIHLVLLHYHFNSALRKLNTDACQIEQAAESIPEGSIVLPVDMTDYWLEAHFSNYLGIEKSIIILDNYEANMGWFPVIWNEGKIPNILINDKSSVSGISWKTKPEANVTRQVDFVFLYGNTSMINEAYWMELNNIVMKDFRLVYFSENEYIKLFQRKI